MEIETPLMWAVGKHFVVKKNKKIVSFIGMVEQEINVCGYKIKIGAIGNVCTHPDYRKKGYATLLLNEAILFSLYNSQLKKKIMGIRSKIWIISKNKDILAYWAEGETKKNKISIGYNREYSRIRELLAKAWKNRGKKLNLYVPLWDKELKHYLGNESGIKEMGTVILINPEILIKNLTGYFIEQGVDVKFSQHGNRILLKANKKEKRFKNNKDLAKFLFHLNNEKVWENILPLPLPFYGCNYT